MASKVALITPENLLFKPAAPYVDILREAGFEVRYPRNPTLTRGLVSEQETLDELRDADAIIAGGEYFTESLLSALPKLRVIARSGVGYDRVDVAAATRHKVAVTITPTANHESVAEHLLGLLIALAKDIVVHDRLVRSGGWLTHLNEPVRSKTLGILGLGRIGRSVAVRARALGMRVLATEMLAQPEFIAQHAIELVDFETLLAQSDFLTLHCPLTPDTRGLFNKATFDKMKQGSYLLNTARGGLVVERDLVDALQSGKLRGAALDVFEVEPPSTDNPLFQLDNVVLSPHIASADTLAVESMGVEAARCIVKLSRGEWPEGAVVNATLRDEWKW